MVSLSPTVKAYCEASNPWRSTDRYRPQRLSDYGVIERRNSAMINLEIF
jgi:hypothetical protein